MKLDGSYLRSLILEVMQEEGVLEEGWEDQWPNELKDLLLAIQSTVSEPFQESVSKIFLRTANISDLMPVRLVRTVYNQITVMTDKSIKFYTNKVEIYNKYISDIKMAPLVDFPQEEKDEQIAEYEQKIKEELDILAKYQSYRKLADDPFYFGRARRKEVLRQSRAIGSANPNDNLPSLRYINKVIKSMKKQLTKWREKNTESYPDVNVAVGKTLLQLNVTLSNLSSRIFDKFEEDFRWLFLFIKSVRGTGEDTAKKLASMLKKNKDLPMDEYIEEIRKFSLQNNKDYFKDCKDVPAGEPCVFLRLDNGMFWHSTATEYCEITQVEMNNCGSASEKGSILYNLISRSEGGSQKYHVTLEYNEGKGRIVQVLGQANTLPKEKYWPSIAEFFKATGNPLLSKNAFDHMYDENYEEDDDVKQSTDERIKNFVEGIGAKMIPPPAIDSWQSMKEQVRSGYYSDIVEKQPFEGPLTNVFRAAIIHGKDDDNKASMMLNIKMVMQTVSNQLYAETPPDDMGDLLRQDRKKLEEYVKGGELKKEILNFAVPEKYLDSAREIHLKYSRSSDTRVSMRTNGAIVIQVSFIFGVRTKPWTEARGEYLVENFNQLTRYTADKLERVGLSMVFAVVPERAAKVYPEEAKRLADVDDILNDLRLEGKKKKRKLNGNYLRELINEVIEENESSEEFDKLIDLAKQGDGNEMQAWELHQYFDLTDEQIEQLRNIVTKKVIYDADEPGKDLMELGYDFHKDFTDVYGVTPPRNQEFVFNNGDTRLAVDLPGKRKLIFTFWFGADNVDHPSDPWIFMLNDEGEYVTIQTPRAGVIEMAIQTDGAYAGETSGQISKKDVPIQIKKHTGWTEAGVVTEIKEDACMSEIIEEDEHTPKVFIQNILNYIVMAKCKQRGRKNNFDFKQFYNYVYDLKNFDSSLDPVQYFDNFENLRQPSHRKINEQMIPKYKALYSLKTGSGRLDGQWSEYYNPPLKLRHIKLEWVLIEDVKYYLDMANRIIFQFGSKTSKRTINENDDDDFLKKLFDLVSSGEVEQAFDLADSLDMDKELLQRIVNDEGNSYDHGLTFAISDKGTVAILDYALTRPELGDKIKRWLNDDKIGLPFTELGKWDSIKGRYNSTIYYEMYRQVALLVFQNILKNYDQPNELNEENFGATALPNKGDKK